MSARALKNQEWAAELRSQMRQVREVAKKSEGYLVILEK